jgi:hypothetical protein
MTEFGPIGAAVMVAIVVGVLGAIWALAGTKRAYDSIGRGFLDVSDSAPTPDPGEGWAELDEVRQLLAARAVHRARRGEKVRSTDEELSSLLEEDPP